MNQWLSYVGLLYGGMLHRGCHTEDCRAGVCYVNCSGSEVMQCLHVLQYLNALQYVNVLQCLNVMQYLKFVAESECFAVIPPNVTIDVELF